MATKTHYFTGIARWAKLDQEDKYGKFSMQLGLSEGEHEKFKAIGLRNQGKIEDGLYWVTLRRDPNGKVWSDGEQRIAGKPVVVDVNGQPITTLVGNGSEVSVKVQTYDYDNKFGKGVGSRLDAVRVHKLVEFKKDGEVKPDGDFIPF